LCYNEIIKSTSRKGEKQVARTTIPQQPKRRATRRRAKELLRRDRSVKLRCAYDSGWGAERQRDIERHAGWDTLGAPVPSERLDSLFLDLEEGAIDWQEELVGYRLPDSFQPEYWLEPCDGLDDLLDEDPSGHLLGDPDSDAWLMLEPDYEQPRQERSVSPRIHRKAVHARTPSQPQPSAKPRTLLPRHLMAPEDPRLLRRKWR
jgi:hypothetical protein